MLNFEEPSIYERSKCFFTYGRLQHLDPQQLPKEWEKKGKPWTTILSHDFIRRVDLVLPQDSWELIRETLLKETPEFCRVLMALPQILEGAFFTEYIKIGNIIMVSQGRRDLDNVFTLKDGKLTLYLDKATYERAGLVGKPYGVKGNRGLKPRWVVEFDLRSPSMFRGKKGFDRLVHACKNVLNEPVTWLFCNVAHKGGVPSLMSMDIDSLPKPDPLEACQTTRRTASPETLEGFDVTLPPLAPPAELISEPDVQDLPESVSDMYEWLSLVRLQSPRILSTDTIDPYLCRYQAPGETDEQTTVKLCTITWEGLLAPSFARQMLVDVILNLPSHEWFSLTVSSFSKSFAGDAAECTVLRPPRSSGEYLLWDIRSHE